MVSPLSKISSKLAVATATAALSFSLSMQYGDVWAQVAPASQPANQPAAAVVDPDVERLIKQLGNDDAQQRDLAQKQLVARGAAVIPALKKAAEKDEDPEIRTRASAALSQMKDHDTNDTSLITLHTKETAAQDVLNAIGSQAHAQFVGYGAGVMIPGMVNKLVTIDVDQKPFWDVLSDVCGQLNVCPVLDSPGGNAMRLFPSQRNWISQSPHQIVGPYWISVAGISRTRSIDMMGPQSIDDQFSIRLIVYPEPKLQVTQMSDLVLKEAKDDAGNSLMPKAQPAGISRYLLRSRQVTHVVESRLFYPDQPGKKIAVLRGEVTAQLAQDVQKFEVDDVLIAPKVLNPLPHCQVKATVQRQGTEMFRVQLECTRQGLSDDQWSAMMNRMSDVVLEDADGHTLYPLGMAMSNAATDSNFTGSCIFSRSPLGAVLIRPPGAGAAPPVPTTKTGDPKKLTWNVATSLKPVIIPILFKDLPMP